MTEHDGIRNGDRPPDRDGIVKRARQAPVPRVFVEEHVDGILRQVVEHGSVIHEIMRHSELNAGLCNQRPAPCRNRPRTRPVRITEIRRGDVEPDDGFVELLLNELHDVFESLLRRAETETADHRLRGERE